MSREFRLAGVQSIVITPFDEVGRIDSRSLSSLIDATLPAGVTGLTALGVAAEADKLTPEERDLLVHTVFEVVGGRSEIVVGASADDTATVVATSQSAQTLGATGVMVAPPRGMHFGPRLRDHYAALAASIDLPIVFQDYEDVTGVRLSPAEMAELVTAVPKIRAIKLESEPTAERIRETRVRLGDAVSIVGGIGAIHFYDELVAGADGTMTGFAYPEILVAIEQRWRNGDRGGAKQLFDRFEPLLAFEGQRKIGLGVRKEILRRRGRIATALVRDAPPLPDTVLEQLTAVMRRTAVMQAFDSRG